MGIFRLRWFQSFIFTRDQESYRLETKFEKHKSQQRFSSWCLMALMLFDPFMLMHLKIKREAKFLVASRDGNLALVLAKEVI